MYAESAKNLNFYRSSDLNKDFLQFSVSMPILVGTIMLQVIEAAVSCGPVPLGSDLGFG